MLFLRFQDALASERWQEGLSLCSDRVRAKAAEWSSAKAFFKDTIPVDLLLAENFGAWKGICDSSELTGRCTFYELLVPLTEPESKQFIQWYWAIYATNQTWVVDYPPINLEQYVEKEKAAIREREARTKEILDGLEPKVKGVKTRLIPANEQFTIGSPMLFQVELTNSGKTAVEYMDSGVAFAPLSVHDNKGNPLVYPAISGQIQVHRGEVASGASVILAGQIDINRYFCITKPGKYSVQFSGNELTIGQPLPYRSPEAFGGNQNEIMDEFLAVTNRFPSDTIIIEIAPERK